MSLNEDFRSDLEDKSMRSGTDPQKPSCSNRMPKHNSGYSFSDQDAEIMIKCNNEGSYKRGFPAAVFAVVGVAAFAAARQVTYSKFYYAGIGLGSYILGKVSYFDVCRQRLIESDSDSELVQALRKQANFKGKVDRPSEGLKEFTLDSKSNSYSSAAEFDTDRELNLQPQTWQEQSNYK